MSLSNPKSVVTEQRLADFYTAIKPYIGGIEVDDTLSSSSENPVQNKVIKSALDGKASSSHTHTTSDITNLTTVLGNKADKVSNSTSGNFAGLDANGNITDSGHKHSDYLTSHQDISGKADKVTSATNGNFAGLDANGNLTDSGHKHSDYLTQIPTASANTLGGIKVGTNLSIDASTGVLSASGGGHDMIAVNNDIATVTALTNGNDNYVINAYTAKRWSNVDVISILTTASKGTDTIGTWVDDWTASGASRSGWLWDADLYGILDDDDIEIAPVFDMGNSEVVSLYAMRIDDDVDQTINGQTVHGGAVAFKFNGAIQANNGVKVGLNLKHQRTNVKNFTVIS